MKRYTKLIPALLLVCICTAGCGKEEEYTGLPGDKSAEIFASADDVLFGGDLDDINISSDVIVNGVCVGQLRESGLIDGRLTYSVGGEDRFYIAHYTKDDIDDKRYACVAAYAYYDMEGNILGYAQDRVLNKDEDAWYVMTFLDAKGRMKNFYVEPNDKINHHWALGNAVIRSMDKTEIGSVELQFTSYVHDTIRIEEKLGDAAEELSEMDRAAIYWRAEKEMYDIYYHTLDTE